MKGLFMLLFVVGSGMAGSIARRKRSLYQFSEMISCMTGQNALWGYNGYGCWCGKGGKGEPVDATDRCCKEHDECYQKVDREDCTEWWRSIYLESYHYTTADCKTDHASITCDEENDQCETGLCECDRIAVECFNSEEAKSTYDKEKYGFWWNIYC